ncbi:MAG: hypothetical protein Q7T71_03245 [Herbiconiux sp.]|nr:hypothetical protein [Herbiconiux sp.]
MYDVFRQGRIRVDTTLVLQIATVLNADAGQLSDLGEFCARAHNHPQSRNEPRPAGAPHDSGVPAPLPDVSVSLSSGAAGRLVFIVAVIIGAISLNVLGHGFVAWLGLPLYFDMIGTAVAAMALGPWHGVVVGLVTNLAAVPFNSSAAVPFALVNVVGALVWGYGIRFGFGRSLPRFFALNALVAVACTATAVPILLVLFGGMTGHATDLLTGTLEGLGEAPVLAVLSSNLLTSLADKMLAGFVSLVVLAWLAALLNSRDDVVWSPSRSLREVAHVAV